MLVITRKIGERVIIGTNAEITVLRAENKRVLFQFALPARPRIYGDVIIFRELVEENSSFMISVELAIDDVVEWDRVRFMLVSVRGEQVRLGVDAPREIRIYREEVWEKIKEEMAKAASMPTTIPAIPRGFMDSLAAQRKASKKSKDE